ncbi:MAG: proline--tRNA ligase [Bacteroidota bacterium]
MKAPKKDFAYPAGYSELIKAAGLAEHSSVRGCMIIKPYGFALWENMKAILDKAFKQKGHVNAYFPLLIPTSYLSKEASHIQGFAKECAVVTHYRVAYDAKSETIVPDVDAKLQEPLVIRPTSETIIWQSYKNWINSYRDLPLRINQWANVVRWEMRPRLFLRTAEILWQEGHTAHASAEEAEQEALGMLEVYADFMEKTLAIPVVKGKKTLHERFSGAETTYTLEALMQDGKALQAGTSHFLGQNFAKAFEVKFTNQKGVMNYVWGTSWGLTTRLIGAMVMMHSDEKGLLLPPKIAPIQVVIIPIPAREEASSKLIAAEANLLCEALAKRGIRAKIDDRDSYRPGWKFAEYELQGIPLRAVIGLKEVMGKEVTLVRRDSGERVVQGVDDFLDSVDARLDEIQGALYQRALGFRKRQTVYVDDYATFKQVMKTQRGFVMAHWDGTTETEQKINQDTQATIRCIPLNGPEENGKCIYSGRPSGQRVLFAQAY